MYLRRAVISGCTMCMQALGLLWYDSTSTWGPTQVISSERGALTSYTLISPPDTGAEVPLLQLTLLAETCDR